MNEMHNFSTFITINKFKWYPILLIDNRDYPILLIDNRDKKTKNNSILDQDIKTSRHDIYIHQQMYKNIELMNSTEC